VPKKPSYLKILAAYPKAVTHLRWQVKKQRFGLVLGSGASKGFGVPLWKDLVQGIAADPQVDGLALINGEAKEKSLPYRTEMLFERFRSRALAKMAAVAPIEKENSVVAEWHALCRKHIYGTDPVDVSTALPKHPYFASLIPLVQGSMLTINFNFDDFLERSLAKSKRPQDKDNRGFEAVTDPWPQFRRTDAVIYHPHGYVPTGSMEGPVDRFVFSEAGYSKQYVGANGHDTSFLTAHFARNTCLLVGCSLEDELRTVLLRGAQMNPGNYHYYVHFMDDGKVIGDEERLLIEDTNFKVYNLITLFLTAAEIALFTSLLNREAVPDKELRDSASICKAKLKYTYYMTGPLGVGKSTTANLLRSLSVLDEWLEPRLEILGRPWDSLTADEEVEADEWIVDQFSKKNDSLRHEPAPVISVVDRPPLDPLAFTKEDERPAKARTLLSTICPSDAHELEPGVIILLTGIPAELSARVKATGRLEYTAKKLGDMQDTMKKIYGGNTGVVTITTDFLSVAELTKRVAQIIHREKYEPANLMEMLKAHEASAHGSA
jgi:SIR2-like domain